MSEPKRMTSEELAELRDDVDFDDELWGEQLDRVLEHIDAIEAENERLRIFERAMESMAAQMICPKMTALEMATMQLKEPTP